MKLRSTCEMCHKKDWSWRVKNPVVMVPGIKKEAILKTKKICKKCQKKTQEYFNAG